jgi:hypothetical protein
MRAMAALGLMISRVSLTSNGSVLSRAMVRVTDLAGRAAHLLDRLVDGQAQH